MKAHNLIGKQFGRLEVISRIGNDKSGAVLWKCQCECGNQTTSIAASLNKGRKLSCGCLQRDIVRIYASEFRSRN